MSYLSSCVAIVSNKIILVADYSMTGAFGVRNGT